ncbi:MAG: hypothetical protein J6X03_02050, partial [Bacilli bacterium]|nr:hypothetical protein [Bacilli bacterium]
TKIFGDMDEKQMIYATKVGEHNQKPDIYIEVNGVKKYLSVKTGSATKVSEELISTFIPALRSKGVSENSLRTICHYHFGDGSVDGSGKHRQNQFRVLTLLTDRINVMNQELNANKDLIIDFITTSIFKGTKSTNIEADYLYFGNPDYGVLCSKDQILSYVLSTNFDYQRMPHIGCLLFRPHARYVGKEVTNVKRRMTIDIYWPNLFSILAYISENYPN